MSRCFPFSPEAFASRSSNREVSIKLQKERDEIRTEKKKLEDKKRSKKEHKREHRYKEKKLRKEQKKIDERQENKCVKAGLLTENLGHKSEQLEKSDITVENDLPSGSLNFLDSVDSRNKRKRQDGPVEPASKSQRTTFRIRLPLKKHSEPNTSIEQPKFCPTKEAGSCVPLKKPCERNTLEIKCDQPKSCLTNEAATCVKETVDEQISHTKTVADCSGTSHSERKKKRSSKSTLHSHKALIEDWVLPSLARCELDDEDWLFGSRLQSREPKRDCAVEEMCRPLCPPQAMLLREAGIYALPYTLPY